MTDVLESVFRAILTMSATAAAAALVVMLVRLPLKKAPKAVSYGLWFVVLFRLICPVSFQSAWSLFNLRHTALSLVVDQAASPHGTQTVVTAGGGTGTALAEPAAVSPIVPEQTLSIMTVLALVWTVGVLGLMVYGIISYVKTTRSVRAATRLADNIFESDLITSPFVCGFFRPKIYLPTTLTDSERGYIILHEQTHIRRRDYIVKPVWFLAVCLHWFNPLVWASYILLGRDIEMSCDEAVIRKMGDAVRADYSTSLLALSTPRSTITGSPLAFGERHAFSRIKNVLNFKKPVFWVVLLAILAAAVTIIVLAANPLEKTDTASDPAATVTDKIATPVAPSAAPLGEPSYAYGRIDKDDLAYTISPFGADDAVLAKQIIEDFMIKSTAWDALDIRQFDTCYMIRQSYPDGTVLTYYAFMYDGKACLQDESSGQYSIVQTELYDALGQFIDASETAAAVELNLSDIMSSPAYSSNPGDYIDAHREKYEAILKLGQPALDYMLSCFENGEGDTLKGHIMKALCQDLLGPRDSLSGEPLQPSEWYEKLQILQETELPNYVYTGDDPVLKLVYETETAQYHDWNRDGGFSVVAPHVFGSYEEDGYLKVFVTTYAASYNLFGKTLDENSGAIIPAAITYKINADGTYTLTSYKQAQDGSLFAPSIRDYCTMPASGDTIPGLADEILEHYGDYEDLLELQRSNLEKLLADNGITDVELP